MAGRGLRGWTSVGEKTDRSLAEAEHARLAERIARWRFVPVERHARSARISVLRWGPLGTWVAFPQALTKAGSGKGALERFATKCGEQAWVKGHQPAWGIESYPSSYDRRSEMGADQKEN